MSRFAAAQSSNELSSHRLNNRRLFLLTLASGCLASSLTTVGLAQTPDGKTKRRPALLQAPQGIDQLATRARIVLQLAGTLKVADPDPTSKKPSREAEVKAESTVDYDERFCMNDQNKIEAAARHYHEANVKSWVAGHSTSHELRPQCLDARLVRHDGVWQQYCPSTPMQPREIDLVRMPINTAVIDMLLPRGPVKGDTAWSPDELTLAELLQLEAVHSTTVAARVIKVEEGVATIECIGDVEGTVNSVPTKISIDGNLHAALGSQCALVTWAGMSITEAREVSQSEPGFKLTARIQLIRKEEPNACSDVTLDELRAIADSNDDGRWLNQIASIPGRYQMLADRRWKTIVDTGEEAILRLIENNQVLAQCNVTRLPKLATGQQLTLDAFQDDIKRSLGKNFEAMEEASERKNTSQMRVLRAVAVGRSSEVPIRWIYTHISDDSGRRVSLVYTMSGEASERFGTADEQMVSSFELMPEAAAATPTPASPTPAGSPTESAKKPVSITTR